jgi:hypothetical protein
VLKRFRRDPLIGNVLGLIALFVALGAGAYAAGLAPNSVKSKHIVDGQVKSVDVQDNGLTGADIDESSVGEVPSATGADSANFATTAGDANQLDGKDSTQFQLVGSEGWTNLVLQNASAGASCHWQNFPGAFATPGYFRDSDGIVHLRGVVQAVDGAPNACGAIPGLDEVISTLPAGYLPQFRAQFPVTSNNAPGRVDVAPNTGQIVAQPGYPTYANMKVFVSLDGISFRCGPSGTNGCP